MGTHNIPSKTLFHCYNVFKKIDISVALKYGFCLNLFSFSKKF